MRNKTTSTTQYYPVHLTPKTWSSKRYSISRKLRVSERQINPQVMKLEGFSTTSNETGRVFHGEYEELAFRKFE